MTLDKAITDINAQIRICKGIIRQQSQSDIPGVKELLVQLEQYSSGEFADIESVAQIVSHYAILVEKHTIAVSTAVLRGSEPPNRKPWGELAVVRFAIPLKAQFDHWFAMESANKPKERGTEIPPAEPVNRLITVLEQSAAFGAPVITHTPVFQVRGHMIFWAAFDAKSATGELIVEEIEKLKQALHEAAEWGQIPLLKRTLDTKKVGGKKVTKHPRPADYVPPDEYEWRYRWYQDRNYIRAEQGRLFYAALPSLHLAWESQPLLHKLLRESAEVEARNAN